MARMNAARVNRAVTGSIGAVLAQFLRGSTVAVVWRQSEDNFGNVLSNAREWWMECPWSDVASINPVVGELVTVGGIDYAISRVDIDRTTDDWVRITVRPVR